MKNKLIWDTHLFEFQFISDGLVKIVQVLLWGNSISNVNLTLLFNWSSGDVNELWKVNLFGKSKLRASWKSPKWFKSEP